MAAVLFFNASYRTAYAMLLLSSVLALASLVAARLGYPVPSRLEQGRTATERHFTRAYWLYMAASGCFAAGLMSYELISYYLTSAGLVAREWMPVVLAFATGFGVIANLVLGRLYDRFGIRVVLGAVVLSALFTPLVFAGSLAAVLAAMPLWGVGYAIQDTLFKAIVASVLPEHRRGLAFGLFYTGYGCGWLVGSAAVGLLYEHSHLGVVIFAMGAQFISLPLFYLANRRHHPSATGA